MIPGVSVVLERTDGKILIIQETEKKPWKEPGDFSIPMETVKDNENETIEEAIKRTILEEASGVTEYEIGKEIGEGYNILNMAFVRCFYVKVIKFNSNFNGKEVNNHQWVLPEQALNLKSRVGAEDMMKDFIREKDNS